MIHYTYIDTFMELVIALMNWIANNFICHEVLECFNLALLADVGLMLRLTIFNIYIDGLI